MLTVDLEVCRSGASHLSPGGPGRSLLSSLWPHCFTEMAIVAVTDHTFPVSLSGKAFD